MTTVFGVVAVLCLMAAAVSLWRAGLRADRVVSDLEAGTSLMFAGWFSVAVSLHLAHVPWTHDAMLSPWWLAVSASCAASGAVTVLARRAPRPATLPRRDGTGS